MSSTTDVRQARIAVSAVFLLMGAQIAIWAVSVPLIRLKFDLDEAQLGGLILFLGLGSLLAVPTASYVLKRYPHALATRICGYVGLTGMGFVGFMPNLWALASLILLTGVFTAITDISMNANAVDVEAAAGKPVMSSFHGWFSLGGLFGLLMGPLAQNVGLAWMTLLGAAMLIIGFHFYQSRLLDAPVQQVAPKSASSSGVFRNFSWVLLVLALANLTAYSLEGAVIDWSGVFAEKILKSDPAYYGQGFAAFSVTMAIMRFSGDYLRSAFGNRKLLAASCLIGAAAYFIVASSSTTLVATFGYALLGIGMANMVPIFFVMAARIPGVTAGTGIALVAGMGYVGFLTIPPIIGFIARATSLQAVFFGLSALLVATLLVVFVVPKESDEKQT